MKRDGTTRRMIAQPVSLYLIIAGLFVFFCGMVVFSISGRLPLRFICLRAGGLPGHVSRIEMERTRFLFARPLLIWVFVVAHANAPGSIVQLEVTRTPHWQCGPHRNVPM